MEILRLAAGIYAANCYIVYSTSTMEGVIIDPGGDADEILKIINEHNLIIKYIILTHGHADHIGALNDLKEKYNVDIMIHEDDSEMLKDADINLSSSMPMKTVEVKADRLLKDGDKIAIGDKEMLVLHTPGHTKGGICLKIDDSIITGDTIFHGSIGRTDLYGGDFDSIIDSIKSKILIYHDLIVLYPGHGAPSTIGYERIRNPYLQ